MTAIPDRQDGGRQGWPVVSVVVPVYNVKHYVRESLHSLLSQAYRNLEIICVNDGSTDGSADILREYAANDARIRVIDTPNGGYGKAMNTGMDAATGEWMAIFEPDDLLPPDAYGPLVRAALENRADFVRGAFESFKNDTEPRMLNRYEPVITGRLFSPQDEQAYFSHGTATWACLYNLGFLRRNGIRHNEPPGAAFQDTGMFFLAGAFAKRVFCIRDCVYIYRELRPGASLSSVGRNLTPLIHEYTYIRRQLEPHPDLWNRLQGIYLRNLLCGMLFMFRRIRDRGLQKAFLDHWCPFIQASADLDRGKLCGKLLRRFNQVLEGAEACMDAWCGRKGLFLNLTLDMSEIRFFRLPVFSIERPPGFRRYKFLGLTLYRRAR